MKHFTRTLIAAAAAALSLAAGASFAQATLDQKKAEAGGAIPGDAPGFPITIGTSGHYKLTGNLVVPADAEAVVITAPNVTLDLNGFTINGGGQCTYTGLGVALTCTQAPASAGAFSGVRIQAAAATLRNGSVTGFRGAGVWLDSGASGAVVENLRAMHNAAYGIGGNHTSTRDARISGGYMSNNKSHGIYVTAALVERAMVSRNGTGVAGTYGVLTLLSESRVTDNAFLGALSVSARGSMIAANQTDVSNVVSLGGNYMGGSVK